MDLTLIDSIFEPIVCWRRQLVNQVSVGTRWWLRGSEAPFGNTGSRIPPARSRRVAFEALASL